MPASIRATSHLIPLRDPRAPYGRTANTINLADHHKWHHPNEVRVTPTTRFTRTNIAETGYDFFGQFVVAARVENLAYPGFVGGVINIGSMRISDVAVLALEQYFGRAASEEEVFTTEWGVLESRPLGRVFMERKEGKIDSILAEAEEGFSLSQIGTNVVEAAAYLPRIHRSILKRLAAGEIKEGVASVEVEIEGQMEEMALVASPLKISLRLPNLGNVSPPDLDQVVEAALNRALSNKRHLQLVP